MCGRSFRRLKKNFKKQLQVTKDLYLCSRYQRQKVMTTLFDYSGTRYINPLTDFGFKRIFGDKEVMKAFLTDLLQPSSPIKDLIFLDKELGPDNETFRGVIYDLRCMTEDGGEFIVEMQNRGQEHFSERILYYLSRSFSNQKGHSDKDWDYSLKPIYGVFFLNFHMKGFKPRYLRTIQMTVSETGELFSDKLKAFTLEIPDFKDKSEDYPKTMIEYWLYILANMQNFKGQLPFTQKQPVFKKVGMISEIAHLTPDDLRSYDKNMDTIRTNNEVMSFAKNEGRSEGIKEGIKEGIHKVAASMKKMGLPMSQITQATGLSEDEIAAL